MCESANWMSRRARARYEANASISSSFASLSRFLVVERDMAAT